ncbi:MAG: choice-of-anchor M domain-containing protein [Actinomyces sp. oral taxon 181]|nr:choice-of-anchor M domain-containing protein [Actinomyces sp. oral taxon 181]
MKRMSAFNMARALSALFVGIAVSVAVLLPAFADDPLTQHVDSSEQVVREETTIERGHVDLGPKIVDSKPEILARDDSGETPIWRPLHTLVFRVSDSGKLQVPSDPSYSFLHAHEGEPYWVIPQTQNPRVVWLGWNTQDPELIKVMGSGATMTLGNLQGPGKAWLFLQDGAFGAPTVLYDSSTSSQSDIWVEANTHVHANWAFSAPGAYALSVRWCFGDKETPQCVSDTLRFVVGDGAKVEEARALTPNALAASLKEETDTAKPQAPREQGGNSEYLIYGVICLALSVLAFIVVSHRTKKSKKQIEQAREDVLRDFGAESDV